MLSSEGDDQAITSRPLFGLGKKSDKKKKKLNKASKSKTGSRSQTQDDGLLEIAAEASK